MDLIDEILDNVKTIAVVMLSDNPARDSHGVSAYMQRQEYSHHMGRVARCC